jgi:hypothetical protein
MLTDVFDENLNKDLPLSNLIKFVTDASTNSLLQSFLIRIN